MDQAHRTDSGHVPRGEGAGVIDALAITPISKDEMVELATAEYGRLFEILSALSPEDWARPTACDDWDIRLMVAHLLGAAEGNASIRESLHQLRLGRRWAKRNGRPEIDGINAIQVDERRNLTPAQLIEQLRAVAPKAVAGRQKVPGPMRKISVVNPAGGRMTMGHLVDRVYTRDQWMHRLDICASIGIEPELTPDHDGRIVEDVVAEWATVQPGPWSLDLSGPAGGQFRSGSGGDALSFDSVDFCLALSGRKRSDQSLALVVF